MSFISYAQNYEDVMLMRALKDVHAGSYIDVGAQDPVIDSVTKAFYERGWRGINVEPVQVWHEKLVADRPEDINLRIALGAAKGETTLYDIPDTGLSTTDARLAAKHEGEGRPGSRIRVPTATLDAVCREYGVQTVHFLKIDVEGAERDVLAGFSFAIRPWIVLVEATLPNSETPAYADWEPLLLDQGYRLVYQDGLNRFYLDPARAERAKAFATPPNVFDRFVRFPEWRAQVELQQALEAQQRLLSTQDLLEARERAVRAEAERAAAQSLADELRHSMSAWTEVARLRAEQLARLELLAAEQRSTAQALEAQLAERNERLRTAMDAYDRLLLEVEALQLVASRLGVLEAERDGLLVQVSQRDCEAAALRQQVQSMLDSHSWRVTRPLRGARRRFGRAYWRVRSVVSVAARAVLATLASCAPVRWLGRHLFAGNPHLTQRLLRWSGRVPATLPAPVVVSQMAPARSERTALTPRARDILQAMQAAPPSHPAES